LPNLRAELKYKIQNVNASTFDVVAKEVFMYQVNNNIVYRYYISELTMYDEVSPLNDLIYLPISAFKLHQVKSGVWDEQIIFKSSNTGGGGQSQHSVRDANAYLASCHACWNCFYNDTKEYRFLCLLPGYLERDGSSLIFMMEHFSKASGFDSGFFLNEHEALFKALQSSKRDNIKTVLFGVSYALLDFIEHYKLSYPELIVMETGGMKGTRREMLKDEFHSVLKNAFNVDAIHSEYGMTELFSQAYSKGDGMFYPPHQMKIITTQITDPLTREKHGKTGIINIIDLNNLDTCSFIQTEDLGISYPEGSFRLMGRLDQADIRGCNLMVI
jgi:hypothetical protein